MGAGNRQTNTQVIPGRGSDLMGDGGPALSCPLYGSEAAHEAQTELLGRPGELVENGDQTLLTVEGQRAALIVGKAGALLAKCIRREYSYSGRLEVEDGELRVLYKRA
jgi:hypothetical protein